MRNMTISLIQEGKLPVLVCDNLGSRGLDTINCSHVINFEFPKTPQEFALRIGRTGRMG